MSDSEPYDLPWNPRIVEMKPDFSVYRRASFMAPSTASVPLLMKKHFCRFPGAISPRISASAPRSGSRSSWLESGIRSSWRRTASTILG